MLVKNVEKKDTKTATFQVEISAEEFDKAVNQAYLKNKKDINVPGFRKGKAPRAVIESMYGAEVFYNEAIDDLGSEAFYFGFKESGLKIVGTPSVDNVDLSEDKVLTFSYNVELYPEVTLGEYKGLSANKDAVIVTDDMVNAELEREAKRNARLTVVEREAQLGDTVNIDFDGYLDGERFDGGKAEGHDLELGSGSFVPGFEEQIVGLKAGEEKDIDITFPEDYVEDLAGKAVVFKVKVNCVTAHEIPAIDDEFVQDISEFDTLEAYKADMQAKLEKSMGEQAEAKFRSDIIKTACENMTVEIPESMIEAKVTELCRNYASNFGVDASETKLEDLAKMLGIDDEAMAGTIRPAAVAQIETELLFEAVAEKEEIEITDEEVEEYIKGAAESVKATPEDIKNYFGIEYIKAEYKKEKASELIVNSAVVAEIVDPEKAE